MARIKFNQLTTRCDSSSCTESLLKDQPKFSAGVSGNQINKSTQKGPNNSFSLKTTNRIKSTHTPTIICGSKPQITEAPKNTTSSAHTPESDLIQGMMDVIKFLVDILVKGKTEPKSSSLNETNYPCHHSLTDANNFGSQFSSGNSSISTTPTVSTNSTTKPSPETFHGLSDSNNNHQEVKESHLGGSLVKYLKEMLINKLSDAFGKIFASV